MNKLSKYLYSFPPLIVPWLLSQQGKFLFIILRLPINWTAMQIFIACLRLNNNDSLFFILWPIYFPYRYRKSVYQSLNQRPKELCIFAIVFTWVDFAKRWNFNSLIKFHSYAMQWIFFFFAILLSYKILHRRMPSSLHYQSGR